MPERLHEFWPLDLPCFTTYKDPWNAKKIEILEGLGYPVTVLTVDPSPSIRSGTDIRAAIYAGDPAWQNWVPRGSWRMIEEWTSAD